MQIFASVKEDSLKLCTAIQRIYIYESDEREKKTEEEKTSTHKHIVVSVLSFIILVMQTDIPFCNEHSCWYDSLVRNSANKKQILEFVVFYRIFIFLADKNANTCFNANEKKRRIEVSHFEYCA